MPYRDRYKIRDEKVSKTFKLRRATADALDAHCRKTLGVQLSDWLDVVINEQIERDQKALGKEARSKK
jgi:hypothetical protein